MNHHLKNIGIIAHIDAGKTTLTEMILFYAGLIHKFGCVHEGNTTTDWMQQERERGITIVSAAVSLKWKDTKINLIDTPGHLDFNNEVEKCLCVLEGAVVLIDGSKGVEPQTECVWGQANRYKVSRIIFINKMDKDGANFENALNSLNKKLSKKCIAVVYPYIVNNKFKGVYNLIGKYRYVDIDVHKEEKINFNDLADEEQKIVKIKRNEMLEKIAEYDDEIMQKFLEYGESIFKEKELHEKIKELTQSLKIFPVFCGSAYKYQNVKNILDAVITYLKTPKQNMCELYDIKNDQIITVDYNLKEFVGFVFKYVKDEYAGAICYTRIYSGCVSVGDRILNSRSNRVVRIQKIYIMQSDNRESIQKGFAGEIYGIVVDDTYTSDAICSINVRYKINQIQMPEPIIDVAVTPKTKQDQDKFADAIKYYMHEDPTLRIRFNEESSQTIISGVGKLQIEILVSRMLTEKSINITMDKPIVSYRETITSIAEEDYKYAKQTGGRGQFARIHMKIEPLEHTSKNNFIFENKSSGREISTNYIDAIKSGLEETMKCGIYKTPILFVKVIIFSGAMHEVDSSADVFKRVASILFKILLKRANPIVLEPICKLIINTPGEYMNNITGDIYSKQGNVIDCSRDESRDNDYRIIICYLSGEYVFDYADKLRGISKGMASFKYNLHEYAKCHKKTLEQNNLNNNNE